MNKHQGRVLVVAALTVGILYWAVGARVGAGLVQRQLQGLLAGTTTQVLAVDQLRFNPFTLTARFTGLRVDDADTGPVLTAAGGHLSLAFGGLFGSTIAVSDFFLDQPRLVVTVSGPPGKYQMHSLGGLLPVATDDHKRPPIRIARAQITGGDVSVYASTVTGTEPTPMGVHINDINLAMNNLISDATTPASFDLAARINDTGVTSIQGNWVPASRTIEAAVQLNDLDLAPLATVVAAWFDEVQLAGVLTLHGDFRYLAEKPGFEGDLVIEELAVDDHRGETILSASRLAAHGLMIGNGRPAASVQWLELDQPGVALLFGDGGQFNLRELIKGSLPKIDKVTVRDGHLGFTDTRLSSPIQIDANNIAGELTSHVDGSRQTLAMSLTGVLENNGTATLSGVYHVNNEKVQAEGDATLSGADARSVSPYVASWIAREIDAGLLNLNLHYALDENVLSVFNKIGLADLELSAPGQDTPPSGLPVDLAVALLTDENRRMVLELPVKVTSLDSDAAIRQGYGNALTTFINSTAAELMNTLARLAALEADKAGHLEFAAGSTEIGPEAEHQLGLLVDALTRRPLLGVRAHGHYSSRTDREALARRQVELHISLAASTRAGQSAEMPGLDFTDPKVQAVLDEFAAARLNTTERNKLKTDTRKNSDDTGTAATSAYYPAVFEALANKENVSDYALRQLARYRAHAVVGRLQAMGIESPRLQVDRKATPVDTDDAPPAVSLTPMAYRQSDE